MKIMYCSNSFTRYQLLTMPPLTLHVLPPAFSLPSVSADCITAIAYLRYTQKHGTWAVIADAAEHPHLGNLYLLAVLKAV